MGQEASRRCAAADGSAHGRAARRRRCHPGLAAAAAGQPRRADTRPLGSRQRPRAHRAAGGGSGAARAAAAAASSSRGLQLPPLCAARQAHPHARAAEAVCAQRCVPEWSSTAMQPFSRFQSAVEAGLPACLQASAAACRRHCAMLTPAAFTCCPALQRRPATL